jgi:hypothetical protein
MKGPMQLGRLLAIFFGLWLVGCSHSGGSANNADGTVSPTMVGPPEPSYCMTPTTYDNSISITGMAQYLRREIYGNASGGGLGSANPNDPTHPASAHPIRYAEVRVTDNSGQTVQCAETAADGSFSFTLPQGQGSYKVSVLARSAPAPNLNSTTHLYASVLNQPNSNTPYALTATLQAAASQSLGTLTAQASGDLLAGAFNILDQLLNANLFLLNQVGNCSATFSQCADYDAALHKVSVYWVKGFNPNDYFGPDGGGASFYLPGYSRLFILGGINGDTNSSDTDHFDNSVIIHEYGHFLEDNWLKSDSPGGAHDGDQLLDPRLAWSEGWGDFIQAAVTGDPHYMDSIGNVDGNTELAYYIDTEIATDGSDLPRYPGEGNFRELAVTRLLWDVLDDTPGETQFGASDDISNRFAEIWTVLTKSQNGFRDANFSFRNVGLFHLAQVYLQNHPTGSDAAASNWVNIRALNQHEAGESHYAQLLAPSTQSGVCIASASVTPSNTYLNSQNYYFSISPVTDAGNILGLNSSDMFQNNRFYRLHVDSTQVGSHTLQLVYEDDDGSPVVADLDLYLYNSQARLGVVDDMIVYSRNYPTGAQPERVLQTETVTTNLSAGDYLINVNAYTNENPGTTADYNLLLDGVILCPGTLVPQ